MAGHGGVGPVAAEAGQARDDEARVEGVQEGRREVQGVGEDVGPEGVDEDVGGGDEGEEEGARGGGLEGEGDGGFVPG